MQPSGSQAPGRLARPVARLAAWRVAIARVRAAYAMAHGRPPNLLAPRRFTEKVQWRKLFDLDPRYAIFCDKLATRAFVAARLGEAVLPPLLWSGGAADIPFDDLVPPYVLKATHGAGQFVMIGRGETPDRAALRGRAEAWLAHDHGRASDEPGYNAVPRRIVAERAVTGPTGERPDEHRFFVFDGRVAVINTVFIEDERVRNGAFHRADWTPLDWHFSRRVERAFPRPPRLAEMSRVAELLGAGLDHVRIDFYDGGERFWVGEMTLYAWSGKVPFNPDEADFMLGAEWRLRRPMLRAAKALLLHDPWDIRPDAADRRPGRGGRQPRPHPPVADATGPSLSRDAGEGVVAHEPIRTRGGRA
jgi:hypothetical protein